MPGKLAAARASREASERLAQLPRRAASTQGGLPTELEDAASQGAESVTVLRTSADRLLRNPSTLETSYSQAPSPRHQQPQQHPHDALTSSQSVTFLVCSGQHGQNGTPTVTAAAIAQHILGGGIAGGGGVAGGSYTGSGGPASSGLPPRTPSGGMPPLTLVSGAALAATRPGQGGSSSAHSSTAFLAGASSPTGDPARGPWTAASGSILQQRASLQWLAADEPKSTCSNAAGGGTAGASSPQAAGLAAAASTVSGPVGVAGAGSSVAAQPATAALAIVGTASGLGAVAGAASVGASSAAAGPPNSGGAQQPVNAASEQVWTAVALTDRSRASMAAAGAMPRRHSRLRIAATASELPATSLSPGSGAGVGAVDVGSADGSPSTRYGEPTPQGLRSQGSGSGAATPVAATTLERTVSPLPDTPRSPVKPGSESIAAWTASAARAGGSSSGVNGGAAGGAAVGRMGSFVGRGWQPSQRRMTPAGSTGFCGVSELFSPDGARAEEPPLSAESSFTVRQTPSDMEEEALERARTRRAIRSLTLASMGVEPRSSEGPMSATGAAAAGSVQTVSPPGAHVRIKRAETDDGAVVDDAAEAVALQPNGTASRAPIRLNHQPGHHRRPPNRHASMPTMKKEGVNVGTGGGMRKSTLMRPPASGGLLPEEGVPEDAEAEDAASMMYGDDDAGIGGGGGAGGAADMASGFSRMPSDSPVTSQMSVISSVVGPGPGSTTQQRHLATQQFPPASNGGGAAAAFAAGLALAPAQPPMPVSRLAGPGGFPPAGVPPALLVRLPDLTGGSSGQRPSFEDDIARVTPTTGGMLLGGSGALSTGPTGPPAANSPQQLSYAGAAADRPSHVSGRLLSGAHAQQPHSNNLAALHKAVEKLMLQDSGLYAKVQASMKGISSLAKETNKLEFVRDASGATVINQYVVVKTLGRGAFGKVKLCLNTLDGQLYAVKMINRAHLLRQLQKPARPLRRRAPPPRNTSDTGLMDLSHRTQTDGNLSISHTNLNSNFGNAAQAAVPARASMDDTSPLAAIMREIAVMKKVDHPHVVRLHEVIDPPGSSYLMMVMEYCEGGCVMETRAQTGLTPLGEDTAREYFRQACLGLDYLHYNNVVHGDLKPENMLVGGAGALKIADFGSSRFMGGDPTDATKTSCTPAFQSPEEIGHMPVNPFAADLWALACCLFCFVFGRLPFVGSCVVDIYRAILTRPHVFPAEVPASAALKDLIDSMLDKDPNKRPKLAEVGRHEWVTAGGQLPPLQLLNAPSAGPAGARGGGGPAGPAGPPLPPVIHVTHAEQVNAIDRSSLVSLVRARLKEKACQPGEYLFKEGEEAHCVYMIMAGVVELTHHLRRPAGHAHGHGHGHGVAAAAGAAHGGGAHGAHGGTHGGAGAGGAAAADGSGGGELGGGDHDASFSVDLDESLTLDHPDMGGTITEAMNIVDGKLHIDRQQAIEMRRRMQGNLLGDNAEYVVEVKGPGSVIGEIGMDNATVTKHRLSARARGPVTVVKLTEENFFKALLQMYGEGGGGGSAASASLTASSVAEAGGGAKGVGGGTAAAAAGASSGAAPGLSAQHLMVMQYLEDSGSCATFPATPSSAAGGVPGRFSMDASAGPSSVAYRQGFGHHHHHHHHHHYLQQQHYRGGSSSNGSALQYQRRNSPQSGSCRDVSPSPHAPAAAAARAATLLKRPAATQGGDGAAATDAAAATPAATATVASDAAPATAGLGSTAAAAHRSTAAALAIARRGGAFGGPPAVPARALGLAGFGSSGGARKAPEVHPMLVNASRGEVGASEEGVADL